ncbi:hypothetical protein EDB82DRAFT_218781 [Fusarium venenatum]|uniref:uncharacterized protein n=1 Tax=Fusarium venenatum TaxID=56646 RepID=UPI001D40A43C|nr:hypothetical protein EDB82DRAFT_218781 [Fusarium venenatum]
MYVVGGFTSLSFPYLTHPCKALSSFSFVLFLLSLRRTISLSRPYLPCLTGTLRLDFRIKRTLPPTDSSRHRDASLTVCPTLSRRKQPFGCTTKLGSLNQHNSTNVAYAHSETTRNLGLHPSFLRPVPRIGSNVVQLLSQFS